MRSAWLVLVLSTACVPAFTTVQRTETLPPGRTSFAGAAGALVGVGGEEDPPESGSSGGSSSTTEFIPSADLAFRVGVAERVDVGLRFGLIGFPIVADVKLQLVKTDLVELAVAPGVGTSLLVLLDAGASGSGAFHTYLPVLAGFRIGAHRLVFGVKYTGAFIQLRIADVTGADYVHFPGAVFGFDFALGGDTHLLPMIDANCAAVEKPVCFLTGGVGVVW